MIRTQRNIVLLVLLVIPLVFYVLLSFGINNFAKLPVVTKNVEDVVTIEASKKVQFRNYISVLCFSGDDFQLASGGFFNLNEKIYKRFYGYKNFQIVVVIPKENSLGLAKLKRQLSGFSGADISKWKFVLASEDSIRRLYKSLRTGETLNQDLYSPKVFLIDKAVNLRGRLEDKDSAGGKLVGYNMESVASLNNKMIDDIKVLLAEYRLALKRNQANRKI